MTLTDDRERVIPFMRTLLIVGAVCVLVAGVQLYVLTGRTGTYFAWTVDQPLTAASIGAFYFGSFAVVTLSALRHRWEMARVGVPAAIVLLLLVAGTVLSDLDALHLHDGRFVPALAAWVFLVLDIAVPILLIVAYVLQRRSSWNPERTPRATPLPWLYLGLSLILGLALSAYGVALFVAPGTYDDYWAWPLTTISARVVAAWLLALGVLLISVAVNADILRARPAFAGMVIAGALELIGLARYWHTAHGWQTGAFIAVFVVVLALGLIGLALVRTAPFPVSGR